MQHQGSRAAPEQHDAQGWRDVAACSGQGHTRARHGPAHLMMLSGGACVPSSHDMLRVLHCGPSAML